MQSQNTATRDVNDFMRGVANAAAEPHCSGPPAGMTRQLNPDGTPNPRYVDLLDRDPPIAGQEYVCMSFCSPEEILRKKDIFYFEQFLKYWDFEKSMQRFHDFLKFISFKYNIDFAPLDDAYAEFVTAERATLVESTLRDDYETFLDNHEEELEKEFSRQNEFCTSVRGLKFRGAFPTQEEAEMRCGVLREIDPNHDVYVGHGGVWMPFHPKYYRTGRTEYMEEELNQLMHEKEANNRKAKVAFEQRVKEAKQQAIEDNIRNAEKTGNVLTQTINEEGKLVGVNTQIYDTFVGDNDGKPMTQEALRDLLFEGDNVVTGKSDNGQSQLRSGPFSTSVATHDAFTAAATQDESVTATATATASASETASSASDDDSVLVQRCDE